ncbi:MULTISPECIES: sensor histidine kinase [Streptosporangium]|uniref:histidine kinase n=1 Tax=Streptosporangium brasiliense TaxID=47480 RepID=A0ABT9RGS7_9ACTN|nr:sensor domain-containing protein [Streptosporangium brasiliense]MDP9867919.1 signal transduction histidine kinase [Streptosporangium brasiliense]
MDRQAERWRVLITTPVRERSQRELAYALMLPFMVGAGLVHLVLVLLSVILTANLVGVPMLALSVMAARGLGTANRRLARAWAGVRVPDPGPFRAGPGLLNRLGSTLGDVTGWRAVIHSLLRLPAAVVACAAAAGLWGGGLLLLGCPLWGQSSALAHLSPPGWPVAALVSAAGLALLLLAPWGVHLALAPERMLARTLLGPGPGDARIRRLEQARALAAEEAVARLRRIERDLHDGTAARLVTLAMSLGMAQDELEQADQPERLQRARVLVDSAHRSAKETMAELRDLIRGIHPPALDQGLEVALATLTARSPIPARFEADLPERPAPAIEAVAYFCTTELLANVVKHSGGQHAAIEVRVRDGLLTLRVRDDGTGGAAIGTGSGLRGLAARAQALDGMIDIHSPAGGPTVITVELPLHI